MRIILLVLGNRAAFGEAGYVVVTLDQNNMTDLIRQIEAAEALYDQDKSVSTVCYDDFGVMFVASRIRDAVSSRADGFRPPWDGFAELPDDIDLGEYDNDAPAVDHPSFVVLPSKQKCRWQAFCKHTDDMLYSSNLTFEQMRALCLAPVADKVR